MPVACIAANGQVKPPNAAAPAAAMSLQPGQQAACRRPPAAAAAACHGRRMGAAAEEAIWPGRQPPTAAGNACLEIAAACSALSSSGPRRGPGTHAAVAAPPRRGALAPCGAPPLGPPALPLLLPHAQGAEKRGDWYRTKDLVVKGSDWIVDQMKKSGGWGGAAAVWGAGAGVGSIRGTRGRPDGWCAASCWCAARRRCRGCRGAAWPALGMARSRGSSCGRRGSSRQPHPAPPAGPWAAGLRGRGGAGFPSGLKWSFMPKVGCCCSRLVGAGSCNAGFKAATPRYLPVHGSPHRPSSRDV